MNMVGLSDGESAIDTSSTECTSCTGATVSMHATSAWCRRMYSTGRWPRTRRDGRSPRAVAGAHPGLDALGLCLRAHADERAVTVLGGAGMDADREAPQLWSEVLLRASEEPVHVDVAVPRGSGAAYGAIQKRQDGLLRFGGRHAGIVRPFDCEWATQISEDRAEAAILQSSSLSSSGPPPATKSNASNKHEQHLAHGCAPSARSDGPNRTAVRPRRGSTLSARPRAPYPRRPRPRRHRALRPGEHPLRDRFDQHAGVEHPQRGALRLRADRGAGAAVRARRRDGAE